MEPKSGHHSRQATVSACKATHSSRCQDQTALQRTEVLFKGCCEAEQALSLCWWHSEQMCEVHTGHTERLCVRTAAASIKSDKPVAISQVLSHKTKPNQMIFVSAADHMW